MNLPRRLLTLSGCLLVALSSAAVAAPSSPSASTGPSQLRPMGPLRARHEIVLYFNNLYVSSATNLYDRVDSVWPHRLVRHGSPCDPKDASSPEANKLTDAPAAQVIDSCDKVHGKFLVTRIPRDQFGLPRQQHLTYVPLLDKLGQEAARSAGVADTAHGNARYIYDSASDLDITYGKATTPTQGVRQLKQLKFHVRHHHETVQEVWY